MYFICLPFFCYHNVDLLIIIMTAEFGPATISVLLKGFYGPITKKPTF
jgi:hypothetical protein